ncbi:hypothetical protein ACFSTC_44990 [Nonomuraea ferruginea]
METALPIAIILVTGLALALVAQWRDWRPPLWAALAVGVVVRVVLMFFAAGDAHQPVDFVNSFKPAGEAVLNGQDPVLASKGGWHFLPTIPYVYGILLWLGIPWEWSGRIVTVVADIVLIPLVAKLAGGPKASLRAFQYALNPLALMVACLHGQVEPVALVFGVAAFVVARGPGAPPPPDGRHRRDQAGAGRPRLVRSPRMGAAHARAGAEAGPRRPGGPQTGAPTPVCSWAWRCAPRAGRSGWSPAWCCCCRSSGPGSWRCSARARCRSSSW